MDGNWETYRISSDSAVTRAERLSLWPVFPFYEVHEVAGDIFAVAPRNVPKDHLIDYDAASIRRAVTYSPSKEKAEKFVNTPYHYAPLEDHPGLFAKFARLGDEEYISRSTWLEWLHKYGVLGIRDLPRGRNDIEEAYYDFIREVRLANRTLRLFEASSRPKGPDIEIIQDLRSGEGDRNASDDPKKLECAALHEVRHTIKQKVHTECYQDLLVRDSDWRKKQKSPLAEKWVFRSLLGSLWLQFMWLTNFDRLRYCEAPGCNSHISPYARTDKTTCSERCRKRLERSRKNIRSS